MNGKNCRAFMMTTVPMTIRIKNGLATGRDAEVIGVIFLRANDPAMARAVISVEYLPTIIATARVRL